MSYPLPREYVCDGSHAKSISRREGTLVIEICKDPLCAAVRATCEHAEAFYEPRTRKRFLRFTHTWYQGKVLACDYCGKDVTPSEPLRRT